MLKVSFSWAVYRASRMVAISLSPMMRREHLRFADEASANVKRQIDEFIARAGIDAPAAEPDPPEIVAPSLPNPPIHTLDPAASGISTVIWCTGFRGDFGWMRLPGVLDAEGQPLHRGRRHGPPWYIFRRPGLRLDAQIRDNIGDRRRGSPSRRTYHRTFIRCGSCDACLEISGALTSLFQSRRRFSILRRNEEAVTHVRNPRFPA